MNDKPWLNEPDRKHWVDEETGFDCLIVRNSMGALCGYVGVPNNHKFYGIDYDELDLEVHGGLTYSDTCDVGGKICHSHEKGDVIANEDVWWLGFDCSHYMDYSPYYSYNDHRDDVKSYKDIAYVENECKKLAIQIKEAE